MLKLHGRLRSNYYNAVKAVLIEKALPFEEVIEPVPPTDAYLALSPTGKIPCLETEHGSLTEAAVIIEYLEAAYPEHPISPADPFAKAKMYELMKHLELYIEWAARRGYGVLRGTEVTEHDRAEVAERMHTASKDLQPLLSFSPWIMGTEFCAADIYAYYMLVYAALSAKANAEMDLWAALPGSQHWLEQIKTRPSMQRVMQEAKAG